MRADELSARFGMQPHAENGCFIEKHYPAPEGERAASGSIYYYVAAEEATKFHVIDCDEYWCHTAGSPLELWQISPEGKVSMELLGTQEGCQPMVYIQKGTVFASRHPEGCDDGTLVVCITVPRFTYDGFTLLGDEEVLSRFPEVSGFYR